MTSIDARLLVGLRGPDLTASTAGLALVEKMGFGDRLVGLKRWDFFHLTTRLVGRAGGRSRCLEEDPRAPEYLL